MAEYNDCISRTQRLAAVRENYLDGKSANSLLYVKQDDLLIYLRWLVCHLHSLKRFNQYMKVKCHSLQKFKFLMNIIDKVGFNSWIFCATYSEVTSHNVPKDGCSHHCESVNYQIVYNSPISLLTGSAVSSHHSQTQYYTERN